MTKHHVLYPLLGLIIAALGLLAFVQYRKQWQAGKDAAVQEARQKATEEQRQKDISQLESQRPTAQTPATPQTVTKFIPLPGPIQVVTEPGKLPTVEIGGDAQQNLDALQNYAIDCSECKVNLKAAQSTIESQKKEIADLRKMATPPFSFAAYLTKNRQGSFGLGGTFDYRITQNWGASVGVANNAVLLGVRHYFGKVPGSEVHE